MLLFFSNNCSGYISILSSLFIKVVLLIKKTSVLKYTDAFGFQVVTEHKLKKGLTAINKSGRGSSQSSWGDLMFGMDSGLKWMFSLHGGDPPQQPKVLPQFPG